MSAEQPLCILVLEKLFFSFVICFGLKIVHISDTTLSQLHLLCCTLGIYYSDETKRPRYDQTTRDATTLWPNQCVQMLLMRIKNEEPNSECIIYGLSASGAADAMLMVSGGVQMDHHSYGMWGNFEVTRYSSGFLGGRLCQLINENY